MTTDPLLSTPAHGLTQCPPPAANQDTPVLITVAEVMLGTAASHSSPQRRRWTGALRRLRTTSRKPSTRRRSRPTRRESYLETAAMAREMHRL